MRTGGSIARLPLSSSWEVSYMPVLLEELWIWILVVSVELKGKKKSMCSLCIGGLALIINS